MTKTTQEQMHHGLRSITELTRELDKNGLSKQRRKKLGLLILGHVAVLHEVVRASAPKPRARKTTPAPEPMLALEG